MNSTRFNLFSLNENMKVLHYSWVAFFISFLVWFNHAPLLGLIAQSLNLSKEEIKTLTLIEANQSYVFDYIDPPAIMEKKSEPKRSLICILSFILGGMLSFLLVLIRHYGFSKKA